MTAILVILAILVGAPIRHGPRDRREIALTFDACPTSDADGFDEAVVEVLRREGVAATFFLSGRWVTRHPHEARTLSASFEIANHGHVHEDGRQASMSYEEALEDLSRAQRAIEKVTGRRPALYRPPAVSYNHEILRAASALGLTTILYDVASGDPDPRLAADRIVRYVLGRARAGSIVIFHVNGRGWTTAETLPKIIAALRDRGYRLVTVSDLLRDEAAAAEAGQEGGQDRL